MSDLLKSLNIMPSPGVEEDHDRSMEGPGMGSSMGSGRRGGMKGSMNGYMG